MQLDFLFGFAVSLLGTMFGNMINGPDEDIEKKKQAQQAHQVQAVVEQKVRDRVGARLEVPDWVKVVPVGHFAGVSVPSSSLAEARKSSVSDVVRQILGSIGVAYHHAYHNKVSGDPRRPVQEVSDSLSGSAHGLVLDVERNLVKSALSQDWSGRHIFFVLVSYPDSKIADVRRLSKGAKVTAEVIGNSENGYQIRVTEAHGVSVVLSSADVRVVKQNRFAKAISFFVWKVPSGSEQKVSFPVGPVTVCGSSAVFPLGLKRSDFVPVDYLLGAQV